MKSDPHTYALQWPACKQQKQRKAKHRKKEWAEKDRSKKRGGNTKTLKSSGACEERERESEHEQRERERERANIKA